MSRKLSVHGRPALLGAIIAFLPFWLAACQRDPRTDSRENEMGAIAHFPAMQIEPIGGIRDEANPFGEIGAVIADDDGTAYVLDTQARHILVFDNAGEFVRTIGRRGAGPGEFESLSGISWAGDNLLALDVVQARFTLFTTTGAVVATQTTGRPFVQRGTPPLYSAGASAFARIRHVIVGGASQEFDEYVIILGDGTIEVVPAVSEPPVGPGGMLCASPDRVHFPGIAIPFTDRGPHRAFLPGVEIALAQKDSFFIQILDVRSGQPLREIRIDYPELPLTDSDWERQPEVQNYRELEQQYGTLLHRSEARECPFLDFRPSTWPIIRTILSDAAGRIWVEATAPDMDGYVFLVFDSEGTPLGRARMPDRDPRVVPYVRGDVLFLVSVNDLGVQTVEMFKFTM